MRPTTGDALPRGVTASTLDLESINRGSNAFVRVRPRASARCGWHTAESRHAFRGVLRLRVPRVRQGGGGRGRPALVPAWCEARFGAKLKTTAALLRAWLRADLLAAWYLPAHTLPRRGARQPWTASRTPSTGARRRYSTPSTLTVTGRSLLVVGARPHRRSAIAAQGDLQ